MLMTFISDEHRLADSVGQRAQQAISYTGIHAWHVNTVISWISEQLSLLDYGINLRYKYTIYVRYISSQVTRRFGNSSLDQWTMVFFIYIAYLTLNNRYELLDSFFQPNQTLNGMLN